MQTYSDKVQLVTLFNPLLTLHVLKHFLGYPILTLQTLLM